MVRGEDVYFPLNIGSQKARKLYAISRSKRCTIIQLIKDIIEEYLVNAMAEGLFLEEKSIHSGQMKTRVIVGAKIAMFRQLNRLSQEELSASVGLHQNSISKVELGLRRLDILEAIAIAQALNISLNEIIDN